MHFGDRADTIDCESGFIMLVNEAHINIGYRFSRPFESRYATMRRVLSVNVGTSLHKIDQTLKAQGFTGENVVCTIVSV